MRYCQEQCGERARTADILDLTSKNEENKVRIEIFQPRMLWLRCAGEIYAAKQPVKFRITVKDL